MATSNKQEEDNIPPCDYCSHNIAVIFCRADSAKLCLFCDHHVHAANALSSKHVRSQICDGCRSAPVSVRCSTDNLVLCRDCDWDAHGVCSVAAAHDRTPVEGFTGCPSPLDLAGNWGLDLDDTHKKKKSFDDPGRDSGHGSGQDSGNWGLDLDDTHHQKKKFNDPGQDSGQWEYPVFDPNSWMQDLMVPDENNNNNDEFKFKFKKLNHNNNNDNGINGCCGKQKNVILKQLTELYKRSLVSGDVPRQQGEEEDEGEGEDEVEHGHQPFTSLLMMQGPLDVDLLKDESLGQNMIWNSKPRDHRGTQVVYLES